MSGWIRQKRLIYIYIFCNGRDNGKIANKVPRNIFRISSGEIRGRRPAPNSLLIRRHVPLPRRPEEKHVFPSGHPHIRRDVQLASELSKETPEGRVCASEPGDTIEDKDIIRYTLLYFFLTTEGVRTVLSLQTKSQKEMHIRKYDRAKISVDDFIGG